MRLIYVFILQIFRGIYFAKYYSEGMRMGMANMTNRENKWVQKKIKKRGGKGKIRLKREETPQKFPSFRVQN